MLYETRGRNFNDVEQSAERKWEEEYEEYLASCEEEAESEAYDDYDIEDYEEERALARLNNLFGDR